MSTNNNRVTKVMLAQRVRDLIAGTQKHPLSGSVSLDGQSFTTDTLVQELQVLANAFSPVDTAKASWKDAMKNLADAKTKVAPVMAAYRTYLVTSYGNASTTLVDFGLTPRKARTPPSAEQVVTAVAKRAATRAARHTAGPKQKAAIKGSVDVAVVTTPTPTPSAAPAPATPSPASPATPPLAQPARAP
jgi:hypothetical protein